MRLYGSSIAHATPRQPAFVALQIRTSVVLACRLSLPLTLRAYWSMTTRRLCDLGTCACDMAPSSILFPASPLPRFLASAREPKARQPISCMLPVPSRLRPQPPKHQTCAQNHAPPSKLSAPVWLANQKLRHHATHIQQSTHSHDCDTSSCTGP